MKFWNGKICLSSRLSLIVMGIVLCSTILFAGVINNIEDPKVIKVVENDDDEGEMWIPTKEDIAYQDSMFNIIQQTQSDLDTIKKEITYILERLDYEDGSWDSIRYVKGGKLDKLRN